MYDSGIILLLFVFSFALTVVLLLNVYLFALVNFCLAHCAPSPFPRVARARGSRHFGPLVSFVSTSAINLNLLNRTHSLHLYSTSLFRFQTHISDTALLSARRTFGICLRPTLS